MDERAQAGLVLLFRSLLVLLRQGEVFGVYRLSDTAFDLRVSTGEGAAKFTVMRTLTPEGLALYEDDEGEAFKLVADLFDRPRRPGSAS